MPSTYSDLKIQLMATGENNTTWGDITNLNLEALEDAIVGSADVTFASANVTLTLTDANTPQTARNLRLRCIGTTGGAPRNLVVPSIEKPYIVQNDCADNIIVRTAAGTGVTVPPGRTMWVMSDGVNVVDVVTHLSGLTLNAPLPLAQGGTGAATAPAARTNLGATTLGSNLFTITNPSAVTFPRFNADNTVSALSAADFRTAIGVGTGTGTVTSVSGTGTVNGLTLTGTVTTSGNLTLGGTLSGVSLTSAVTGVLPVANGGTGTNTAFTTGSVVFAGASGVYSQDNANLFWDDTNNRLGVGTNAPAYRVDIATHAIAMNAFGSVRIGAVTDQASLRLTSGLDGTGVPYGRVDGPVDANSWLAFHTGNPLAERMRVTAAGNVGIGTTSPSSRLHVSDPSAGEVRVTTTTSGNAAVVVNSVGGTAFLELSTTAGINRIFGGSGGTPNLAFATDNVERVRIDNIGRVGIGTTGPNVSLDVNGGIRARGGPPGAGGANNNGYAFNGTGDADSGMFSSADGQLEFYTNNAERFRITAAGGITSANLADAVGYKGLPQNPRTANYTLALADQGYDIYITGTTAAQTITIPANGSVAFPVGTIIQITNDSNQNWSIAITTDTLLWSPNNVTGARTLAPAGQATVRKVSATRWWISGVGLT